MMIKLLIQSHIIHLEVKIQGPDTYAL